MWGIIGAMDSEISLLRTQMQQEQEIRRGNKVFYRPGTTILESIEEDTNDGSFITGIAGKKGFSVITIAKTGMSGDPGTLVRILEILAKHEVNVEYIPSGIDIISLVVVNLSFGTDISQYKLDKE